MRGCGNEGMIHTHTNHTHTGTHKNTHTKAPDHCEGLQLLQENKESRREAVFKLCALVFTHVHTLQTPSYTSQTFNQPGGALLFERVPAERLGDAQRIMCIACEEQGSLEPGSKRVSD